MRRKVLIVENVELNRDLLVQILEDAYDIEVAADGETAVDLAFRAPPDLILMDVALAGLSGLDAARVIRTRLQRVPIVAVSSSVMPGDRARALASGCDEFVAKPIVDLGLVDLVGRLVERV